MLFPDDFFSLLKFDNEVFIKIYVDICRAAHSVNLGAITGRQNHTLSQGLLERGKQRRNFLFVNIKFFSDLNRRCFMVYAKSKQHLLVIPIFQPITNSLYLN